jgi:hypothetical protein
MTEDPSDELRHNRVHGILQRCSTLIFGCRRKRDNEGPGGVFVKIVKEGRSFDG